MKESLILVRDKLVKLLDIMRIFSEKYKSLPALGYTHCQPAQLTTVGKRCTLWLVYIHITRLSIYIYRSYVCTHVLHKLYISLRYTFYILYRMYTLHYTLYMRYIYRMQDFLIDLGELDRLIVELPMRGVKGTTGTQATFLGQWYMSL